MSYELRVMTSTLRVTSSNPRVKSQETSTSCKIKGTSWEIKSTSQEVKITKQEMKSTSQIRVKRKNPRFKILNFTTYKGFYLLSLYANSTAQRLVNLSLMLSNLEASTLPAQHGFEKSLCDHYILIIIIVQQLGKLESLIQIG